MGLGTMGGVLVTLKSQSLKVASRTTLVASFAPGLAPAVPTANVIVEKVNKVITAADVPQSASARIYPTIYALELIPLFPDPGPGVEELTEFAELKPHGLEILLPSGAAQCRGPDFPR